LLLFVIAGYWPLQPAEAPLQMRTPVSDDVISNSIVTLGEAFVSPNGLVLAFELASILLLAALVGSIYVAWPPAEEDER
jgi:NADH:ubiquinone oxidoreductase subunit 6 (subunit J)